MALVTWIVSRLLMIAFLQSGRAWPDEQADSQPSPPAVAAEHAPPDQRPGGEDREADKQRKAMAGLMALCGILIGGLMFVAGVMIWGARLRRMARRELPAQKTLDKDLWFLKPPKSPPE